MFRPVSRLLEQQQGDGSGNGGGDGGAAGAQPDPNELAKLVNQAVTSQLGRLLPKALETALGKVTASLDEKLAALQPAQGQGGDANQGNQGAQGQGQQGQDDHSKRIADLEKKNAQLLKSIEESERRAKENEHKVRTENALAEMRKSLTGKVKPEFLDFVVNHLQKVEDRLQFGEDGTPLMRVGVPAYKGAPPEDTLFTLGEGINEWLKSDAAKLFIPPPVPAKGPAIGGRFTNAGKAPAQGTNGTQGPRSLTELQQQFPEVKFDDLT